MKKFNPKLYQNKQRVYSELHGYRGISKLWIWDNTSQEYKPPPKGKAYLARKSILNFSKTKRINKFFDSLEAARRWQLETESVQNLKSDKIQGLTFKDILSKWKSRAFNMLKEGTQVRYLKIISRYFGPLLDTEMSSFNSTTVDDWIGFLISSPRTDRRTNFTHELDLLSVVLNFHLEHSDDFVFPIKKRHRKAIRVKDAEFRNKDLSEEDFIKFREKLHKLKNGSLFATLATVQFYQALRISEVAALHWEDVNLNIASPFESRIAISKSIKWIRTAGSLPRLENNFKNSKANGGVKEQPLFESTFNALLNYRTSSSDAGLVFTVDGKILTYRQIQSAYDNAFRSAKLAFSGTHVMRHGGCRRIFNKNGDVGLAQQVLGNRDMRSVVTYAQRSTSALNEYARKEWSSRKELVANDCNSENTNLSESSKQVFSKV